MLDLPGNYGVSATFNVAEFSSFEFDNLDSRMSPFEQGGTNVEIRSPTPFHQVADSHSAGNDTSNSNIRRNEDSNIHTSDTQSHSSGNEGNDITLGGNGHFKQHPRLDPLQDISGPITRLRAKKMKEALATLIQATRAKEEMKLQDFSSYFVNILIVNVNGPNV